jgi:AraC-like DNA-binding protein
VLYEMIKPRDRTAPGVAEVPEMLHFSSTDVDQARFLLNRFYYPVTLGVPEGPDGFAMDLRLIQSGPITIGRASCGSVVTVVASELDAYHVTLPMTGRVLTRHAGHEVTATVSEGAVFGPGDPVYCLHEARAAEIELKIERPALEAELDALLGRPVDGPIDLAPAITLAAGPGRGWGRTVRLMHDELGRPETLLHEPLIAERIRHAVLSGLLFSVPHRYREELTAPARAGAPRAIRRVVDAIHDEPERPYSVADLAGVAGTSVRSLQEGFRRHVGCAPTAYLQQVRLERVEAELREADPADVTVAAVAHRWGFAHLGRFASAYRARFGESPSQTLRGGH